VKNYEYTSDQKNDEGESQNGVQICHIPNLFEPHSEQNLDVSLKYGAPHSSQNFAGLGGCAASYNSA
jgi:hypothetical protein